MPPPTVTGQERFGRLKRDVWSLVHRGGGTRESGYLEAQSEVGCVSALRQDGVVSRVRRRALLVELRHGAMHRPSILRGHGAGVGLAAGIAMNSAPVGRRCWSALVALGVCPLPCGLGCLFLDRSPDARPYFESAPVSYLCGIVPWWASCLT